MTRSSFGKRLHSGQNDNNRYYVYHCNFSAWNKIKYIILLWSRNTFLLLVLLNLLVKLITTCTSNESKLAAIYLCSMLRWKRNVIALLAVYYALIILLQNIFATLTFPNITYCGSYQGTRGGGSATVRSSYKCPKREIVIHSF